MFQSAPADLVAPRCRAVALLVDGENLPPTLAGRAIMAARPLGALAILRVYGDAPHLGAGWRDHGFQPILTHAGKNVTDMALTVAAMELSYGGTIDGFAIASRDRDFAPLAWSLKARGFPVWGLSPVAMPQPLAMAYTRHLVLAPEPRHPAPAPTPDLREAAIRNSLAVPLTPAQFGHAMKLAGYTKPDGAARWESWLRTHATFVRVSGDGAAKRFSLA